MNWRGEETIRPGTSIAPGSAFVIVLILAFMSLACWSFADPLVAAPDEQSHLLHAYALDHGQLGTATIPPSKVVVNVSVPTSLYFAAIYPICWHQHESVSATCSAPWPTSRLAVTVPIYVDHYPPLYYLVVGTATYVSQERSGIYMMRLISCLMGALMLAVAAYAIARWSRRRALYAAMYIALTPEVYFLSSSINPSGFETMTSICLWTLVAIFALEYRLKPPRELVVLLGIVASIFILIRGLSPVWVALAGVVLIFLCGPRELFQLVRARRDLRIAGVSIVAVGVLALTWILTQGTLNILPVGNAVPKNASLASVIHIVSSYIQGWIRQMIGILGWLDTELNGYVYRSWYTIVIGVLVLALWRGNWRERTVVATLSALVVLVPLALVTRQAKTLGVVWQGRDTLPLAVGALIMAIAVASGPLRHRALRATDRLRPVLRDRVARTILVGVIAELAVGNMLAFYINLRRYAVGRYGPSLFFLHHEGWSPPTGQLLTLLVYGLTTTVFAAILMLWLWFSPAPTESSALFGREV